MKLIPDWRLAWKFLSVRAAVLLALLSGIQGDVLPLVAPIFPAHLWPYISGGIALTIVVLRLVSQDGLAVERAQISLDQLEAETETQPLTTKMAEPSTYNPMPAGRLERYIGAVAGVVIAVGLLFMLGLLWSLR